MEQARKAQWFLAHTKQADDDDVNAWCVELTTALVQTGWNTRVVAGRDDYSDRAAALGGWKAWCRDVPCGKDYTGSPLYHGVIVPVDSLIDTPIIGKATGQILLGFLRERKHVYSWCPDSNTFRQVTAVVECDNDSWVSWACLEFAS